VNDVEDDMENEDTEILKNSELARSGKFYAFSRL
jgi:hypothetical protein